MPINKSTHVDFDIGIVDGPLSAATFKKNQSRRRKRRRRKKNNNNKKKRSKDQKRFSVVKEEKERRRREGVRTKCHLQLPLILHFSNGVRKYRMHNRYFSQPFEKVRVLIIDKMIDKGKKIYEGFHK